MFSLCPPDGPGAESRPPSHPRPPAHCKEEARLLQRLPAEVQLTGEQVFPFEEERKFKSHKCFWQRNTRKNTQRLQLGKEATTQNNNKIYPGCLFIKNGIMALWVMMSVCSAQYNVCVFSWKCLKRTVYLLYIWWCWGTFSSLSTSCRLFNLI